MTVPITPLKPEECLPDPDAGVGALRTERGNLPLESVDITADVSGLRAGVEVIQGFRNPFDVPLEATYVFPLPARAAVTGFRMEADDRVVEGVLKERGRARADYDRAVAQGKRAAIAEEDRPDVFTIRVGNIVPGESVRVRLTLSQPLPYEDGAATFRFPLVVAPRYIPGTPLGDAPAGSGTAPDTDAVPDASRLNPPVLLPGFPDPVRLSLAVHIDPAGLHLREMRSSLHVVTTEGLDVALRPGERLDRDFILRLFFVASTSLVLIPDPQPAGNEDSAPPEGAAGEKSGATGTGTFALTLVPPAADAARTPRDVVLVLDRSGSMGGWKMVAARRAAARIVDTLTSKDRFAVLSFDTVVERPERLPEGLAEASDRHRFRAVEHLSRLEARGGTEMLTPLRQALALLGESARDRVLVLVTDGQVGNEDQILESVGAGLSGVRVHTVGIDRAVNAGFLGRLAGLGAGRCELVESEDRLDEAMEHIHRRIGAPLVTDLSLEAAGLDLIDATVTPVGSLFSGVPLTVSGRYRGSGNDTDGTDGTDGGAAAPAIAVHGLTDEGQPWERRVGATVGGTLAVRAVWARAHLRALEDRYTVGDRSLEPAILDASLRFGVLCRFTAFVAIDTRVVAEGGPRHQVSQPVEAPSGWEMPAAPMAHGGFTLSGAPPAPGGGSGYGPAGAAPESFAYGMPDAVAASAPAPRSASRLRSRMPAARPAARPAGGTPADGDFVRRQLEEELTRLRAAESRPAPERLRHLADLGSRLAALAVYFPGVDELTTLATELQAAERTGADLTGLWQRTVDLLTRLTHPGGASGDATSPPPSPGPTPDGPDGPGAPATRRPFWRRS